MFDSDSEDWGDGRAFANDVSLFLSTILDGEEVTLWQSILRKNGVNSKRMIDRLGRTCDAAHLQQVVERWQVQKKGATAAQATLVVAAILRSGVM